MIDFNTLNKTIPIGVVLGYAYLSRVQLAINDYVNGEIKKIIVLGGDHKSYNWALNSQVKEQDLFLEKKSIHTLDEVYYVKYLQNVLQLQNILVYTSEYHMKRVHFLFQKMKVQNINLKSVSEKWPFMIKLFNFFLEKIKMVIFFILITWKSL